MAQYRTNPKIKHLILEKATQLFYERGYKDTLIESIATELDISKGLITYHYKAKADLGCDVYEFHKNAVSTLVEINLNEMNYKVESHILLTVQSIFHLRSYNNDDKMRRFYLEIAKEYYSRRTDTYSNLLYKNQFSKIDYENDEDKMLINITAGAITTLKTLYFEQKLNCSFDFFENYYLSLPYMLLKIPETTIKSYITKSQEIAKKININFKPNFVVE